MQFKSIVLGSLFAAVSQGQLIKADDSAEGTKYSVKFDKEVTGTISFTGANNGSVLVDVDLKGLPEVGGPFPYHVHVLPVPSNGSCIATGGHLDPYNGSMTPTSLADTQVGDLSSRWGKLVAPSDNLSYYDDYLSLNSSDPAFIGGRSVVIHFSNDTRFVCANIFEDESKGNYTTTSASVTHSNGAVQNYGYMGAAIAGLAAFLL